MSEKAVNLGGKYQKEPPGWNPGALGTLWRGRRAAVGHSVSCWSEVGCGAGGRSEVVPAPTAWPGSVW